MDAAEPPPRAGGGPERYAPWGLPKDEFTDNGHWPHQLYIREARRMVSDYVMTERHCSGKRAVPESIGLAAYAMDSHNVQRHVKNGMVKNEGDVQSRSPAPIRFPTAPSSRKRASARTCWCHGGSPASHMAFGSIRMEPVFMILSQSAVIAADLCLRHDLAVQELGYEKLRPALIEAGQALDVE